MRKIEEIENQLVSILENNTNALNNIKSKISAAEDAAKIAVQRMTDATTAGNVELYSKAKAEKTKAEDAAEMYRAMYADFEQKPIMADDEIKKIERELEEITNAKNEEIHKKIKPVEKFARECAEEVSSTIKHYDRLRVMINEKIKREENTRYYGYRNYDVYNVCATIAEKVKGLN